MKEGINKPSHKRTPCKSSELATKKIACQKNKRLQARLPERLVTITQTKKTNRDRGVLRIFDSDNLTIGSITSDSDLSTRDFMGLISAVPIHRITYDIVSGMGFEADDLIFTKH